MNNIPEEEIARLLADAATDSDVAKLEDWISSNPNNQEVFTEYLDAYNYQILKPEFNSSKAFDKLHKRMEQEETQVFFKARQSTILKMAASFLIIIISGLFIFNNINKEVDDSLIVKSNPFGQKSTIQLSDGTIVKLNSGSKLTYPKEFHGSERRVFLKGEAFFDVTRDEKHPFLVVSNNITTEVLGTSFNINAFENEVKVTVATGKVKVSELNGAKVFILPTEQALYNEALGLVKGNVDLSKELAWINNTIRFEDASIDLIASKLEKWYGVEINIDGVEGEACSLTGNFKDENLINILEAISWSTGLNWVKNKNEFQLKGKCK